ncbi:oligosaccharide flippase family protein [Anoxybacillus sp. LAT_38]|uniref:oligosaccharide flippase family protein n=1 Tax=Anoxybacillus sp. LAT_26 TaxID=2862719 RepID=UPI0035CA80F7|nr:oligosaccharide flippase family protein [Anoxybacillus sp. LAT_26]MCG6199249.1 oligosaccharide flippase family protein [Anoxybacillus sp. LAT_38]
MKEQIINIILRGLTLFAKFIVVFLLAKFLSEKELGDYSLIVSFITISIYIIGFEYYTNLTRLYIRFSKKELKSKLLLNQLYFHISMYILNSISLWIMVNINIIDKKYFFLLLILLFFEFVSQEIARILITISKSVMSNLIVFIRSGLWVYLMIPVYLISPNILSVRSIIIFWIIHSFLSVFIGLIFIRRQFILSTLRKPSYRIIMYGIKKSIPFFFSTISYVISINIDKFILKFFYGSNIVGIYSFYFSIINAIYSFIFAGSISVFLPHIIKYYNEKSYFQFESTLRKMNFNSIFILVITSLFSLLLLDWIIYLVKKEIFNDYKFILLILLTGLIFNITSQVYHYRLYVGNYDKYLMRASFFSLAIIILSNIISVPFLSIYGSAFSYLLGMLSLLLMKIAYYKKISGELA